MQRQTANIFAGTEQTFGFSYFANFTTSDVYIVDSQTRESNLFGDSSDQGVTITNNGNKRSIIEVPSLGVNFVRPLECSRQMNGYLREPILPTSYGIILLFTEHVYVFYFQL